MKLVIANNSSTPQLFKIRIGDTTSNPVAYKITNAEEASNQGGSSRLPWRTSQVLTLTSGQELAILNSSLGDYNHAAALEFTADLPGSLTLHTICRHGGVPTHFGYNLVACGTIWESCAQQSYSIDFFAWEGYESDYDSVMGDPEMETYYIAEHGTYLGSLVLVTPDGPNDSYDSAYWLPVDSVANGDTGGY